MLFSAIGTLIRIVCLRSFRQALLPVDPDLKFNASHGNDLMFVDVAKFIELPETVILNRVPRRYD